MRDGIIIVALVSGITQHYTIGMQRMIVNHYYSTVLTGRNTG